MRSFDNLTMAHMICKVALSLVFEVCGTMAMLEIIMSTQIFQVCPMQ